MSVWMRTKETFLWFSFLPFGELAFIQSGTTSFHCCKSSETQKKLNLCFVRKKGVLSVFQVRHCASYHVCSLHDPCYIVRAQHVRLRPSSGMSVWRLISTLTRYSESLHVLVQYNSTSATFLKKVPYLAIAHWKFYKVIFVVCKFILSKLAIAHWKFYKVIFVVCKFILSKLNYSLLVHADQ